MYVNSDLEGMLTFIGQFRLFIMCTASSSPSLYFNLISLSLHNCRLKSDNHIKIFFWRRSIRKWLLDFIGSWGSTDSHDRRETFCCECLPSWKYVIIRDSVTGLLSIKLCNAVTFSPGKVLFLVMGVFTLLKRAEWLITSICCVLDAGLPIRLLN